MNATTETEATDVRKELGKIKSIRFGMGGYQDAMIGVTFEIGGQGWGVMDFWGDWGIERSEFAKWSEDDRIQSLGNMVMRVRTLLSDAGKEHLHQLANVPVEVEFKNYSVLKSWRILKEVL
jgi:hypothetical protein